MIYRYLLRVDYVDRIPVRRHKKDRAVLHQPWRKQYQLTLGILRVHRQIYDGAIDVLYRENEWVLYSETPPCALPESHRCLLSPDSFKRS